VRSKLVQSEYEMKLIPTDVSFVSYSRNVFIIINTWYMSKQTALRCICHVEEFVLLFEIVTLSAARTDQFYVRPTVVLLYA
jgi:hypothetical protein